MSAPLTLVTGASRGIGRAIALEAAAQGHALALVCQTRQDQLAGVTAAAESAGSPHVVGFTADLCHAAEVERVFASVATHGRLTGLVNCAGYSGERVTFSQAPIDMIERVIGSNLWSTLWCCRAAIPLMARRGEQDGGGGAIVNLSSQSARFGGDRLAPYAAAKAAIEGLTISLGRELAPEGIRVNAVSPGPVLTEPLQALPPEKLKGMQASLPMGRFCEPQEVARTVLWLLSDAASYISGAIVPVHGAR